MRKIASVLLSVALVSAALAGCGDKNTASNGTGGEGSGSTEKVTLQLLSLKQEQAGQDAFNQIIAKFEDENPDITIDLQSMSSDQLKTTLRARIASNEMPDLVTWMKEIEPEYLLDLTGESFLSNLNNESVSAANTIYDGKVYAMPIDNGYIGFYYNKAVLADNGLEIPKTLSELKAVSEALKAKGIPAFATGAKDLSVAYMPLIALFSETVFGQNPDWSQQRDEGSVKIATDANWKLAFDLHKDYVYGFSDTSNAFNISYDDANAMLAQGKAAFYGNGSWALEPIRQVGPDADIGLMAFPVSENPEDAKLLVFPDTSLSVAKDSKHTAEAKKFLEFMTTETAGTIWSETVKVSSSVNGVNVDYDPIAADINEYISSGQFTPYGDRVLRSVFTDKLWEDFSKYMLGKTDWSKLSADLDTAWDKAREIEQNN
ncbi:ABC transporter substrate-binding protein [Paenibacillus sp. S150]|uniref:ABC transporter substrate-binding protein n=1 Tax=Paenibacillus sp. S150 TaxID=2749826 RepID=UPI001C56BAA8|nr:extracellular solute-binding protein [Paenibacillus sp. S150]MBW4079837.1 extracellular solute-binding protein [Paenibacillus sp. S150]